MARHDIFKTNFAGDTSTLYANDGKGFCDDRTFAAGVGINTRWLGWGVGFLDLDNDGWLDLFLVNGHVYPEVERLQDGGGIQAAESRLSESAQRPIPGRDRNRSVRPRRPPRPAAGRRLAISTMTAISTSSSTTFTMSRISSRLDSPAGAHWLSVKLVGTRSNRSAIGARVRLVTADGRQVQEVRGGGSYYSQNDQRVHFGLGKSTRVERLEIRWPNGLEEMWTDVGIDRTVRLTEGSGAAAPFVK